MKTLNFYRFSKFFCAEGKAKPTTPLGIHSMLLALEPRMVFDASLAATVDAVDNHAVQPAMQAEATAESSAEASAHNQDTLERATSERTSFGAPGDALNSPQRSPFAWSETPEVQFTGSFTTGEDVTLSLGGGKLLIVDPDSDDFTITIKVENGTLSLDYVPGVVDNQYTWNADRTEVTFAGDKGVCQRVLDTLKYTGDKDYNGSDSLTVSINDGTNPVETYTQDLTITSVAEKPAFPGLPADAGVTLPYEDIDTKLLFNYGTSNAPDWRSISIFDPDGAFNSGNDRYTLELAIDNGKLHADIGLLTLGSGTKVGDTTTYSVNGLTLDEVNRLLDNLYFQGDKNFFGSTPLKISVTDTDASLVDKTLTQSFSVNVLAVNDAPTLKPVDEADTANQLHVKEVEADHTTPSEGVFNLGHFNTDYNPAIHTPDASGNLPLFDVDNNLHQLVVKIDSAPTQGSLWRKIGIDWVKLGNNSTFSLWDVYNGNVKYVHNPDIQVSESLSLGSERDSFTYTLNDGAGSTSSGITHIALDPVNQPPQAIIRPGGIVPDERLQTAWGIDPVTGESVLEYTQWAYEGEQGIPFSFDILDPDQAPGNDYTISFKTLPSPTLGVFWYSSDGVDYVKVTTSMNLSLALIQAGNLRFCHSGVEKGGTVSFQLYVKDDGGGEGNAGKKTITADMKLHIRDNNDHPEWHPNLGTIWDDTEHTVGNNTGNRLVALDNSFLNLADQDSSNQRLTYTIKDINGDNGKLLYKTDQFDPFGKSIYREIAVGDKITQVDIDGGKIFWWFHGSGDLSVDVQFIVRDGCLTAVPTPADGDQPVDYPFGGPSPTGWEHGTGFHEGGIGTWVETTPGMYEWQLTEHTLHIIVTNVAPGTPVDPIATINPIPHFDTTGGVTVSEGQLTQFDKDTLHAWFTDANKPGDITDQNGYPSATAYNLTYRVENAPRHGNLLYSADNGTTFSVISIYGSFTQNDINTGKIYYLHNSSEVFADAFNFSVSDGRNEVFNTDGTTVFSQELSITPRNDTPEALVGKDLHVKEHDLLPGESANSSTPGGIAIITPEHILVVDKDGTKGSAGTALDPGGFSDTNDLYVIITELPQYGTLYLNGVTIVAVNPADLTAVKEGNGWATWATDPAITDKSFTVISLADIASGKLTYKHNGDEQFYDGFKYLVSDNKGISPTDASHDSFQLMGDSLVLMPKNQASMGQSEQSVSIIVDTANDIPEPSTPSPPAITVTEGGTATINKDIANAYAEHIKYLDPDGSPEAIQFILTEAPKYGELLLNGRVLGLGSVFTQADVDAGLVQYKHNGTENHADTFTCKVSDSIYTSSPIDFDIDILQENIAPTITTPDILYVDSLAGGIIIENIKITDPDYGGKLPGDIGYPGSGIVSDEMTVTIDLSSTFAGMDLDKIEVLFFGGGTGLTSNSRTGDTITLVGSYQALQNALKEVTVRSGGGNEGTTYDPNGDILLKVTVHDGVWDAGTTSWVKPNGGGGIVYTSDSTVCVYISPLNDAPTVNRPGGVGGLHVNEDGGWRAVKDGVVPLEISDPDAFGRGGNSITLHVEHGKLNVSIVAGVTISGRGSDTLTISGPLDKINAVLATLVYQANQNYNGADAIQFVYKDNANSGALRAADQNLTVLPGDPFAAGLTHDALYQYTNADGKAGFARYGELVITVDPVNDAPVLQAPDEVFFAGKNNFDGTDANGNAITIVLDDIDKHTAGHYTDEITVTLNVTSGGWLEFSPADLTSLTVTSDTALGTGYSQITLTGTLANVDAILRQMEYNRTAWNGDAEDYVTIKVDDKLQGTPGYNGAPSGTDLSFTKSIKIYCSDTNDAPTLTPLPGWTVDEDATAGKIFDGLGKTITIDDPDSFDKQIYFTLSVTSGELALLKADLAAAGFVFTGNPALQDKFAISADKKTVYLLASQAKITAALKEISYKPPVNYNGSAAVTVYVNDLGMWGLVPQGTPVVVPGNPLGVIGTGLASTDTGTITITAINDAPTVNNGANANKDFWTGPGGTVADKEDGGIWTGKTVEDLFGGFFKDTADQQSTAQNSTGSLANDFAGIVIAGNAATAAQGTWQYFNTGTSLWTDIPTTVALNSALFLEKSTQIRFEAAPHFNGKPGALTVRLVDDSSTTNSHGPLPSNYNNVDISGVNSGGTTRYSANHVVLSTAVTAVNDAPTVVGGTATLPAVDEDANPAGSTVGSIFGSNFDDQTDNKTGLGGAGASSANGLAGVVITQNDALAEGKWQYSVNGTTWVDINDSLTDANGLFLASTTSLRFVPVADWNGTPGKLTVHLVDNSTANSADGNLALPVNESTVDLSAAKATGGNTRYSTGTVVLDTAVNAVNDAPVVVSGTSETLPGITEDTTVNLGATVKDIFSSHFEDRKETASGGLGVNTFEGVLVVGNTATAAQGNWEYSSDGGTTWATIPNTIAANQGFALQATWNVRFQPAADFNGTPGSLTVRLIDTSAAVPSGVNANPAANYGSLATIASVGGVTRYSADTVSLGISVSAVNDAPTIDTGKETVTQNHTEDTTTTTTVESLFSPSFIDARDQISGGSSPNAFDGIIVTQNTVTAAQGAWEYFEGTWKPLSTTLSDTDGVFLAKGTQLRFVPAAEYNGTLGSLTVRLVETGHPYATGQTSVDVSGTNSGGTTSVSAAAVTLDGAISAVNDAPIAQNPNIPLTYPSILEDANPAGTSVGNIFGSSFDDATDAQSGGGNTTGSLSNTLAGIIIQNVTVDASKGAWQYFDGSTWKNLANDMFVGESTRIRFMPAPDWNGTAPNLTAYLVENSGSYATTPPTSGTVVSATSRGGSTPISMDALTLQATVTAVNDAPTWNDGAFSSVSSTSNDHFIHFGTVVPSDQSSSHITGQTVEQALHGKNNVYAFLDGRDTVPGGSNADTLQGILITGLTGTTALGTWEYHDGTIWVSITAVAPGNALFLDKGTNLRFVYYKSYDIPSGTMPHAGLTIALVDSSASAMATGSTYSATTRGGTTAYSADLIPLWVAVIPKNYYPIITSPPSSVTVTERDSAYTQLAPGITVTDRNLDAGAGSTWNGASVSIQRQGGANGEDTFNSSNPLLTNLTQGDNLVYNNVTYGTVTRNSGGLLTLTFNSSAKAINVNAILQSIGYSNMSHNPATTIDLQWTVDDGNYVSSGMYPQGSNDPGDTSGKEYASQTVTILPVNDAPVAVNDVGEINVETSSGVSGNVLDNDWDWDNIRADLSVDTGSLAVNIPLQYGTLTLNANGSYTYTLNTLHPTVMALQKGQNLTETYLYKIHDPSNALSNEASLTIRICKPLPPGQHCPLEDSKNPNQAAVPPARPGIGVGGDVMYGVATDKPVVKEAEIAKRALSSSVTSNLSSLDERLLNMASDSPRSLITLMEELGDQVIYVGQMQTLQLPAGLFSHSDKNINLSYKATLVDGSPLPTWMTWSGEKLSITGNPPEVIGEPIIIRIEARDTNDNSAATFFRLNVTESLPEAAQPDTQQEALPDMQLDTQPETQSDMQPDTRLDTQPEVQPDMQPSSDGRAGEKLSYNFGSLDFNDQIAQSGQGALLFKAHESLRQLYGG